MFLTKYNPLPGKILLIHNTTSPDIDGTFTLSWSESLDAKNYTLYQSNSSISKVDSSVNKIMEENTNRTIKFHNLEEGIYYYIVIGYNNYGNTTSNLINITVQYPPGEFFLYHDADFPDKDGTVNLTWSHSQGAEYYDLYINDSLYQDIIIENSYVVNNLDTGDYGIAIFAINEAGERQSDEVTIYIRRSPSSFSFLTDATNPDTDGTFELIWTKSAYSSYYVIYNSTALIAEINDTSSILLNFIPSFDLPTYRYNLSGLKNGTFYYKIYAFNQYGNYSTKCVQIQVTLPHIPQILQKPSPRYVFPYEIIVYIIAFTVLGILIIVYKKFKK